MAQQSLGAEVGHHFDHHAPENRGEHLYEVYGELRSVPVGRSATHGGFWIVAGHDDVIAAELDPATYSSAHGVFLPRDPLAPPQVALEEDPPVHTRSREVQQRLLTRASVVAAEPHIRELSRRYLAALAAAGPADFVAEVAAKVPVEVIAHMLGLGMEVSSRLRELTEEMWDRLNSRGDGSGLGGLAEVLQQELDARRDSPRDDYLTWLTGQDGAEPPMDPARTIMLLLGLTIAGHETTMNAAANLAYQLAVDPGLQERLRAQPALIPAAVDESLRHRSPVQNFFRTLTRDVELHGIRMSAGDKVLLVFGAANRDPRAYPDPDTFDIDRGARRHLAFGAGVHRCVGASLALAELRILFGELVANYSIAPAGEVEFGSPSGFGAFLGIGSLPVVLRAR